jgi:transposase
MAVFDPRQVRGQRLAFGATAGGCPRLAQVGRGGDPPGRGEVGLQVFLEEAQLVRVEPFGGDWVVFRNKAGNRLKLVVFDGTGFWLCYRRLERGHWVWPKVGDRVMALSYPQFLLLIQGQDWRWVKVPEAIRPSLI